MTYPAHIEPFIDLLVETLVRDLTNENAPAAVLAGQATEARRHDEDTA